jgi:hypothetical protein
MDVKFPRTMKAAIRADVSVWSLADALVVEATTEDTGPRGLNAVVAEMVDHGIEPPTNRYLRLMRQTAVEFPKDRRYDGEHKTPIIPLRSHHAAGNADTLDVIVKVARKEGHRINTNYIEDVMRRLRADERARLTQEREKERVKADQARERKQQHRKQESKAADEKTREHHRRERERAAQEEREAREREKSVKFSSLRTKLKTPTEEEIGPLAAITNFKANAGKARKLATESMKLLKPHIPELSQAIVAGLADAAMTAANTWRDAATTITQTSGLGKGHLSVVNE